MKKIVVKMTTLGSGARVGYTERGSRQALGKLFAYLLGDSPIAGFPAIRESTETIQTYNQIAANYQEQTK